MSTFKMTVLSKFINYKLLSIAGLSLVTVATVLSFRSSPIQDIELDIASFTSVNTAPASGPRNDSIKDIVNPPSYEYQIQSGDTLSEIFAKLGIPLSDMQQVMEADLDNLRIDTLRPGHLLRFWLDDSRQRLDKLELEFNAAQRVDYQRVNEGGFEFVEITLPGTWKSSVAAGSIYGSFSVSAQKAGLDFSEINEIINLLKDKVNFSRDLKAGDTFEVVVANQYIEGKATGLHDIKAIRLENRGRTISAYLHEDGNYYDANGESLQRAFLPYPSAKRWRISSSFNANRRHPVTGRRAPHNGVDFAAPSGTPVLATGDGVVVMTTNHPYAGRYIVIQHGTNYRTRYLHNSKILVKKGQKVSRGQQIALSGQTGRVTGPHIHYEFLIRNKPVNPMTAKIPMASSVPTKEKVQFEQTVAKYNKLMRLEDTNPIEIAKQ
ncbi:peptidoglycan DD-metalloendopeptidase family protein [Photobacterium indicum]|uniref:Peptidase M23 n=1 Tax=Photobacterium indicum TaxID=81447 RepID=A0A2T3L4N0_9GAMM|nr:peptidoglycan DD-metalloendopeptidase family protein [Photobacterium indicum]PSV44468.1 peptidase M23 [Photobacterium indicum]